MEARLLVVCAMFSSTKKINPDLPPPGSPLSVRTGDQLQGNATYIDVSTLQGLVKDIAIVSSQM